MSRKRTQAEKSWQEEEDGDAPPKRSRRANQAQDKENDSNPNVPTQEDLETIMPSNKRTVVLTNMQGNVAAELRSGRIKKIVLKNFMCHRNFEVNLNPSVNVFVGLNGSGKSAILTAIAIGLGSKAQSTARSGNLKDLVRRGETSATIEITLTNDGADAYKPEVYGKEITVERIINSNSGASTYKIKSEKNRKIIATTKKALENLTLGMNIQVENPMLILNQDAARSFLKECDPKKLYKFFMKATQIEDIIEKLNSTVKNATSFKNNIGVMEKRIERDGIEVQELESKLSRLQSVEKLRQQIVSCKIEIEWLHIIAREKDLLKSKQTLESTRAEVLKIEDFLKNQNTHEKEAKDLMCQMAATFEALGKDLNTKDKQYKEAQEAYMAEVNKEKGSESKINENKKRVEVTQKNIDDLEKDIAEHESNPDNLGNLRRENEGKIEDREKKLDEAKTILRNAQQDFKMFNDNVSLSDDKLTDIAGRLQREQNLIQKINNQIGQYRQMGKDGMMAYGASMSKLLQEVEQLHRQNKFSALPRGPIGRYIEVTDSKFRAVVETVLDRTLSAFIVNNDQDRVLLKRTMQKYQDLRNTSIICCKFQNQVYKFHQGIAKISDADGVVLINVLKVDDPVVMNCLIDQKSVERIVLVENIDKAIHLTQDEQNVPLNLLKVLLLNPLSEYYPAPSYRTYSLRQHPARYIQTNVKELIAGAEEDKRSIQKRIANLNNESGQVQNQMKEQEKAVQEKKRVLRELNHHIAVLNNELKELKAIEYPEEENIEHKRELLEDEQAKYAALTEKMEAMMNKQKTLQEISNNFKKKVDQAQQEHTSIREKMGKIQKIIEKTELDMNAMKHDISNKANMLHTYKVTEAQNAAEVAQLTNELQGMMQNAQGKRVECNRTEEDIKVQIKSIEKRIQRIESNNENIGDIEKLLEDKKKAHTDQKFIVNSLKELHKKLEDMRVERFQYVKKLRFFMISRMKQMFENLMKIRNYSGEVQINIEDKTLELKIIPRDTQIEGAVSNTKSLSGGERSYSTVAFLISLWHCVNHSFYFLDEYDVFSDEYNRHIMTTLLFNEAAKNPSKQYGFLTPQDFSNIQATDTITIHKLQDPGRKE